MNWELISGIFSALHCLEEHHSWDMSVGENACYGEILYKHLSKGFPKSKKAVYVMLEEANAHTWGEDNTCEKYRDEELRAILFAVDDALDTSVTLGKNSYVNRVENLLKGAE